MLSNSTLNSKYSTIVLDIGSGVTKAGFSGEDLPSKMFESCVGIPKMPGLLVGMEERERYVGDQAIERYEIMNFHHPINSGIIENWERYETLLHHLFYSELKIVPEEINALITECPFDSKNDRSKQAELLFETFNLEKIHLGNSSMLGLYSYGKTSGLILDSGFGLTSSVPIYEGYPLNHASFKINFAGEFLSETLLSMIKNLGINPGLKQIKARIIADDLKEKYGYIAKDYDEEEKLVLTKEPKEYILPDKVKIKLASELFKHCEFLFQPQNFGFISVQDLVKKSLEKCDYDIFGDIVENICLIGGTTLINGFPARLKKEIKSDHENALVHFSHERQFSSWIGGSIITSMNNFGNMWVTKNEYYELGGLEALDAKCY